MYAEVPRGRQKGEMLEIYKSCTDELKATALKEILNGKNTTYDKQDCKIGEAQNGQTQHSCNR